MNLDLILDDAPERKKCIVDCVDTQVSLEISQSLMPGHFAFCSRDQDFVEHVKCLMNIFFERIKLNVCDTLEDFENDAFHYRKRKQYCTDLILKMINVCLDDNDERLSLHRNKNVTECLRNKFDINELIELKDTLSSYARYDSKISFLLNYS